MKNNLVKLALMGAMLSGIGPSYDTGSVYGGKVEYQKFLDEHGDGKYKKLDSTFLKTKALAELNDTRSFSIDGVGSKNTYRLRTFDPETKEYSFENKIVPGREKAEEERLKNPSKPGFITEGHENAVLKTAYETALYIFFNVMKTLNEKIENSEK